MIRYLVFSLALFGASASASATPLRQLRSQVVQKLASFKGVQVKYALSPINGKKAGIFVEVPLRKDVGKVYRAAGGTTTINTAPAANILGVFQSERASSGRPIALIVSANQQD